LVHAYKTLETLDNPQIKVFLFKIEVQLLAFMRGLREGRKESGVAHHKTIIKF
jgi:hypothetical protein